MAETLTAPAPDPSATPGLEPNEENVTDIPNQPSPISAVWRNQDVDQPVTIVGDGGNVDGVDYLLIENPDSPAGYSGVPKDEVIFAEPESSSSESTPEDISEEDTGKKHLEWIQKNAGQVVDNSTGVASKAADYGDEQLRQQTTEKGFLKGFIRGKIWRGNIARDYIRQREVRRSRRSDIETGVIGSLSGTTKEVHDQAMQATTERFTSEYGSLLHQGETNLELDQSGTEGSDELETRLRDEIKLFAHGDIEEDVLQSRKAEILRDFGSRQQRQDRNKGLIYADNIIEVALNARAAFKHHVGMDAIDAALKFKLGEARMGVRTQASREVVDRAVDVLYSTRLGSMVNETTIGTTAAIAMGATKFTVRKLVTAAAATVGLGVGTGIVAGVRESHHTKQERRLHSRQMAEGGEVESGSRRRERMEETRYATVTAESLTSQLQSSLQEYETSQELGSLSGILRDVTDAQTRIVMSDDLNADLITYESKGTVERQRTDLDMAVARAKAVLQGFIDSRTDEDLQHVGVDRVSVEDIIGSRSEQLREVIQQDMSQKDSAFNRLRVERAAGAAIIGLTVGIVLGAGSQELHAVLDSHLQGAFEHAAPGQDRRTELAAFFQHSQTSHNLHDFAHSGYQSGNNALDLPQGYHVIHGAAGVPEMVGPGNQVVGSVSFSPDGHLSAVSQHMLEQSGMKLHSTVEAFTTTHSEATTVSPTDYVAAHPNQFTTVHRDLWYDNNTPYSDRNELAPRWGSGGTGVDASGNFTFDLSHLTAGGSFEGNQAANAPALIEGHQLAIAWSLDQASQNHVILSPIDATTDQLTLDHNSAVVQAAFSNVNGHADFHGGYLEVVELRGPSPDGGEVIRPLATLIGSNHPGNTLTNTTVVQQAGEHVITHIEAPTATPIEVTPVIPLRSRRGMEDLATLPPNPNLIPMYYGGRSLEELRGWVAEDPSRLHSRHEITNPDGTKSWVESDGSTVERKVEREREAVESYLEKVRQARAVYYQQVEKVADTMEPMKDQCRVAVTVPAWMEAKNLRHFLEQYMVQTDTEGNPLAPETYEVNVLINRRTGTAADDSVEVIEKFIADFERDHGVKPNVNYYNVEVDPPNNNVGYARKLLTDAVILRSLRRSGQSAPLYVETEDADLVKLDPHTITNLITKLDDNPQLDAVSGVADRAPEYLQQNDMLFLRRRIWDFAQLMARNKRFRDPNSPSWNYLWNRNWLNGWNTGYSAEAYALVDGYDTIPVGEDMLLGERIAMIRGDGSSPNLDVVGKVGTRSDGSPRRFIVEIQRGREAYAPGEFEDEGLNQELRESSIEDLLSTITKYERITPENEADFTKLINSYSSFVKTVTPSTAAASQMTHRLLFWLGFKKDDYELTKNGVTVKSWDNVRQALENYRSRYAAQATT